MGRKAADAFLDEVEAPSAPTPKSRADAFLDEVDTPAPPRDVNVPMRGMTTDDLSLARTHLGTATFQRMKELGATDEEALAEEDKATKAAMVTGDEADSAAVRAQLEAHEGPDSLAKVGTRAFGRGVMVAPIVEPSKEQRDKAYEQRVRENEAALGDLGAVGALTSAVRGEKAEPAALAKDQQKEWLREGLTASANWLAAKSNSARAVDALYAAATGEHLFGPAPTTDELKETIRRSAEEMQRDPDMQALGLTQEEGDWIPGKQALRVAKRALPLVPHLIAKTPFGEAAGEIRKATGMDEGETLLMWDDATTREAFDAATHDFYSGSGTREAVDALPLRELPARLRGEDIDLASFKAAADAGNPALAALDKAKGRNDDTWLGVIESLPLSTLAQVQPNLRPSDEEVREAIRARDVAAKWSGAPQAKALENLMVAGIMRPLDNGKDAMFVPSRFQDAMRILAVPFAAVAIEPDVHPTVWWTPEAPEAGDTSVWAKWRASRIPTVRGVESMVESGAFNDWLAASGLFGGGEGYNSAIEGPSSYLSRVLADAAMGDFGARGYEDVYERAGGDPHSMTGKALGTIDLALQFLLPAEDVVTVPMGATLRAGNRARIANRALREMGVPAKDARRAALDAAKPWVTGGTDPIAAFGNSTADLLRDRWKSGELDPDKMTPANVEGLKQLAIAAKVKDPEATVKRLMDYLRDRRMRVMDTAAEGLRTGGPETQKLRASRAYADTAAAMDRMVAAGNFKNAAERDVALSMLETQAFEAWDNGEVASPEEYFARQSWSRANADEERAVGNVPGGGEGLEAGTLYSGKPLSDEDRAIVRDLAVYLRDDYLEHMAGDFPEGQSWMEDALAGIAGDDPSVIRMFSAWTEPARELIESSSLNDRDLARAIRDAISDPQRFYSQEGGVVRGSIEPTRVPVTETPAFRAWFGDSKVVDAEGKPLVVYHGTDKTFDAFIPHELQDVYTLDGQEVPVVQSWDMGPDSQGQPEGFHYQAVQRAHAMGVEEALDFTRREAAKLGNVSNDERRMLTDLERMQGKKLDHKVASRPSGGGTWFTPDTNYSYIANAHYRDGGNVVPVYLSIKNPIILDAAQIESAGRPWAVEKYAAMGYDGAIFASNPADITRGGWNGATQIVAFHPEQIKSATANVGTFDPTNPSILYERSGAITPTPTTKTVPNPERAAWLAKGQDAAARVKALEEADAARLAQLETTRNALRNNPQPSDREWRTELDAAEEALADFKPSPEYAAAVEELARLRAEKPPARNVDVPDGSRWLIRLFKTGDILTAFHEGGGHLMALMSPSWEAKAAKFFDSVNGRLTVKGHEQLAEAVTRLLRGKFRPGSAIDNLGRDVLDTLGDVWRRIRTKPLVEKVPANLRATIDHALPDNAIPADFARVWDQTFRPDQMAMAEAVHIEDAKQGRAFPPIVPVSAEPGQRVLEARGPRAGKAAMAKDIGMDPAAIQVALGLTGGAQDVDPVDFMTNAMTHLAVERFRKAWGASGPLKMLPSGRTAVPEARHAKVVAESDAARVAAMGGRPSPIQGTNDLALDAGQAAGLRRIVREVADSPLGDRIPESLTDPGADLTRVSAEDYNTLAALHTDLSAGWGAWRELRAERAATSGAVRLLTLGNDRIRRTDLGKAAESVQRAFDSSLDNTIRMQPAQAEFMASVQRQLGQAGPQVQEAAARIADVWRKGGTDFKAVDLVREVAKGISPEVVPVGQLDALAQLTPLLLNANLESVAQSAEEIHAFFAHTPLDASAGDARLIESDAVRRLDNLHRAFVETNDMEAALPLAGETQQSADDAMRIVVDGIQRRATAVDDVGREITQTFFGSNDLTKVEALKDPAVRERVFRENYARWYSGDWTGILDVTDQMGGEVSGQLYDQGSAALSVLTRLNARRILRQAARDMAIAGLPGDVANLARGRGGAGPYSAGKLESGLQAYVQDVSDYIATISGWTTGKEGFVNPETGEFVTLGGHGRTTSRGVVNPQAYDEACRVMAQFGVQPVNVTSWDAMDMPGGGRILAPRFMLDNIKTVMDEGAPFAIARRDRWSWEPKVGDIVPGSSAQRQLAADEKAINLAVRTLAGMWAYSGGMLRKGLLTGIGPIVKPGYYVTQFLGGINALHQRMGAAGALRVLTSPVIGGTDASVIRGVMARLYGSPDILTPPSVGFWTKDGRYLTDQMIAAQVAKSGMMTSLPKVEWGQNIIESLVNEEPTALNNLNRWRIPGTRAWRKLVDDAAGGIDNMYRVATYVDALKSGQSVEAAGRVARDVAFDFNDMTDFEKKYMRKAVLFYTFQRRNQDLFWWTLLNNPARLAGEMRLLNGLQRETLGDDSEIYANPYGDGRLALRFRDALVEGHAANAQRGALTISPGLNIGDQVGLWLDIMGTLQGAAHFEVDRPSVGRLVGRLNPWAQAVPALAGFDIERMRMLGDASATIPQPVVDADYAISSLFGNYDDEMLGGSLTRDVFQAKPVRPWDNADAPTDTGVVYEVDRTRPGAAFAWWAFNNLVPYGAVATQAQNMERAAGVIAPRAGVTQAEEAGGVLGFRTASVPTRAKVVGEAINRRAKELENRARQEEQKSATGPRE